MARARLRLAPALLGAAALGLGALAGCVAAVPIPLGSTERGAAALPEPTVASILPGPWDLVSFEVLSWGQPVRSWRMLPDGSGSWTQAERADGAPLDRYSLATHALAEDPQAAARLTTLIGTLPFPAPDRARCETLMTDQPYGTLRLARGATVVELGFDSGCRDAAYQAFGDTLRAADELVATRGRNSPVTSRAAGDLAAP